MSNVIVERIPEKRIAGRRLGRHVEHDMRSRAFGIAMYQHPLKSVKHERHCDPFDQGDIGSCTGNATAGACMTGSLFRAGRILTEADAIEIYKLATKLDRIPGEYPPDDTGSSGLAAARAAQKMGLISGYHHAFGFNQAIYALSQAPLIVGTDWFEGMDEPQGADAIVEATGEIRGGHEYVADELDVENGLIGFTNSWGINWGNRGRFKMTFRTFRQLLRSSGDATVLIH